MENAVNALKLAFAIVVFILALTLLFQTATRAREVATSLITEADQTTYYTYQPTENNPLVSVNYGDATVVTRIVKLEDMIPTIYRYSIESYGVTIIDDGEIVARFDTATEALCNIINNLTTTDAQINNIIYEINNYVLNPVGADTIESKDDLVDLFRKIYEQDNNGHETINKDYECPWQGNPYTQWIAQRIDSDLSGIQTYFNRFISWGKYI